MVTSTFSFIRNVFLNPLVTGLLKLWVFSKELTSSLIEIHKLPVTCYKIKSWVKVRFFKIPEILKIKQV